MHVPVDANGGMSRYSAVVKLSASNMLLWPTAVNPRAQDLVEASKKIPKSPLEKRIYETAMAVGGDDHSIQFPLLNRGGLLFVSDVSTDSHGNITHLIFKDYDSPDPMTGLGDGVTTATVLLHHQRKIEAAIESGVIDPDQSNLDLIYYPLELVVGCNDPHLIRRMVESRNRTNAVKDRSLDNYDGKYDMIKKAVDCPNSIMWHERDTGTGKVRRIEDVLCQFYGFFPSLGFDDEFNGEFSKAASRRSKIMAAHSNNSSDVEAILPIASDILRLYEFIESKLQQWYSWKDQRTNKRDHPKDEIFKIMVKYRKKPLFDKLSKPITFGIYKYERSIKTIHKVVVLAILHSLRCITELNAKGQVVWRRDPFDFLEKFGPEITHACFYEFEGLGYLVNVFCKDNDAASHVYDKVYKFRDRQTAYVARNSSGKRLSNKK